MFKSAEVDEDVEGDFAAPTADKFAADETVEPPDVELEDAEEVDKEEPVRGPR